MTETVSFNRVKAWHRALWRVSRGASGNITDRWQDKGARGARLFGRVFSRVYVTNSRCALVKRGPLQQRSPNCFNVISRCVGLLP